jgi:hypothetical protein
MPEQDKTEAGYGGDRKIVSHAGIPPKTMAPLHLWSAGADRAALAIPPSSEQLELEAKLVVARQNYEKVIGEVAKEERKRVARESFADPDGITGPVVILAGSTGATRIGEAEQQISAIRVQVAKLEAHREFKMRQWREKHGA